MSRKKDELPGVENDNPSLIDCGSAVYGAPRDETAEPAAPPDPEMERRAREAMFRILPVSPIVN